MPAFLAMVEGDEGYVGGVYFTPQDIHARRAVCDEWQDGELSGAIVRRMPHFDQYEDIGSVPMSAMMLEGWWSECANCGYQIALEKIDDNGDEIYMDPDEVIGYFGGHCFCNQKCQDEWKAKHDMKASLSARAENRMKAKVESMLGVNGISYTRFECHVDFSTDSPFVYWSQLKFYVPGCQYGGVSYYVDAEPGQAEKHTLLCASGDLEVFSKFFTERTGKVLDRTQLSD